MSDTSGASGSSGGFKSFQPKFMGAPQQKAPDQKIRDVANLYEKHFLREMMKAMRSTVHEGGFIQTNHAEKIFREQLDDQYVDRWSEKGGIGLSEMIYNQLMEKFGVMMGLRAPVVKPQGPLAFDGKSRLVAQPFQHPGKKQALSYRIDVKDISTRQEVKSPWDGILLGKKSLADDQTLLEVGHDNGLKSQVVFKGTFSQAQVGEKLQAGETLGFLSPEAKSLYWTVESQSETGPQPVSE